LGKIFHFSYTDDDFYSQEKNIFSKNENKEQNLLWSQNLLERTQSSALLTLCANFVCFADYSGHIYCFFRKSGKLWWSFDTRNKLFAIINICFFSCANFSHTLKIAVFKCDIKYFYPLFLAQFWSCQRPPYILWDFWQPQATTFWCMFESTLNLMPPFF
jgi:hypothetical protein